MRHETTGKRKIFCIVLCAMLLALSYPAKAQQPNKIPRIGFVSGTDPKNPGPTVEAFQQGLRDRGYVDQQNLVIEYRYGQDMNERSPAVVAELVQLNVDVLVVAGLPAILAAKQATKTIPIVIMMNADPVAAGIVDSLARPGGNITGLTRLTRELGGKRLELLKETVPKITRVGVLWNGKGMSLDIAFKEYELAARALKIQLQSLGVQGPKPDFDGVFRAAVNERAHAIIVITDALLGRYSKQIADLAIKQRLPSMNEQARYVDDGGLMFYSANEIEIYRRAAVFVDKILKGAKPAALPVEQPTKFEFVINLKTAKQIGLTIPPNVLARADKVIK
jgi:putative tryptophan/tyrosine transport system substrate-binding protein